MIKARLPLAVMLLLLLAAPARALWLPAVGPAGLSAAAPLRAGAAALARAEFADRLNMGWGAVRGGEWERGAALLAPLVGRMFPADDAAALPLARCLINLSRPDEALRLLDATLNTAQGPWAAQAHVLAGRALVDLKQPAAGLAHLGLVRDAPDWVQSELDLVRALALNGVGRGPEARAILERVARTDPTFIKARHAPEMAALYERGLGGSPIVLDAAGLAERADNLLAGQEYGLALETCRELRQRFPAEAERMGFLWTWAKVHFRLEDQQARQDNYGDIYRRYSGASDGQGQFQAGMAAWRRGRPEDDELALAHYRRAYDLEPKAQVGHDALMRGGRLALARGRYAEAERFFGDLVVAFPRAKDADEARLLGAICLLSDGRAAEASAPLDELLSKGGSLTPAALYWSARARAAQGQRNVAADLRSSLRRRYPRSYYAVITELDLAAQPWKFDERTAQGLLQAHGERNERIRFATEMLVQQIGMIADSEQRLGCSTRLVRPLRRVQILIAGGEHSLCRHDLKELLALTPDTPAGRAALLSLYELAGEMRWSLNLAYELNKRSDSERSAALKAALGLSPLQLAYPPSWIELIAPACRAEDLDPALLISLIRQESGFDADAVSLSNARGLSQFIPPTAEAVAAELGLGPLHRDQALDPRVNVRLGAHLLKGLLARFDGNAVLALAAYNAGGSVVGEWGERGMADMPPDVAAEAIMYEQTRDYVKTIVSNVAVYRRLYATVPE